MKAKTPRKSKRKPSNENKRKASSYPEEKTKTGTDAGGREGSGKIGASEILAATITASGGLSGENSSDISIGVVLKTIKSPRGRPSLGLAFITGRIDKYKLTRPNTLTGVEP